MSVDPKIQAAAAGFPRIGALLDVHSLGGGHIHDSYLLTASADGAVERFVLQRLNQHVFPAPVLVMDNIRRVTKHVRERLAAEGCEDLARRSLQLVPAMNDESHYRSKDGAYWRAYSYVARTCTLVVVDNPGRAFQAARVVGCFHRLLADFPPPRLHDTIPDFHNTPVRLAALHRAATADVCGRVGGARAEIDYAFEQESGCGLLQQIQRQGLIPERVIHNDTKIGNILFDDASGEGLCLIDLDTVMPGLAVHDFGDMVRTMTTGCDEDELELGSVEVQRSLFEAVAGGYLHETHSLLLPAEREHLVPAARLIALEQGVRFLTDFLAGDTYYKIRHPDHNLQRCRCQFKLARSIARQETDLQAIIRQI